MAGQWRRLRRWETVTGAVVVVSALLLVTLGSGRSSTATAVVQPGGAENHAPQRTSLATQGERDALRPLIMPGPGRTVGIGTPITVMFNRPVANRAAVERVMKIQASPSVVGAWHWFSPTEVHYRPKEFWPARTTVRVTVNLAGVLAGNGVRGDRDYRYSFSVGDSHVSVVDARAHTMKVYQNGSLLWTWPTSLGKPGAQTRGGFYTVLEKKASMRMTSCSVGIACDQRDPEYYDMDVLWNVRLTNSGTFVHAAPWSEPAQGVANVSHGCINLSTANGESFYNFSQRGDIVQVVNSPRGADDLVRSRDPGMVDWNMSWSDWTAGSALS